MEEMQGWNKLRKLHTFAQIKHVQMCVYIYTNPCEAVCVVCVCPIIQGLVRKQNPRELL